jgi:dihydroxy-acid dehydratase
MLRQDGLLETDRDHPIIGVCNTWNEIVPGHLHLRDLAEQVKLGIRSSGGVGLEYGCVAPCDGFGNANAGYRYILPMRDNIADSVELMAEAHHFDGMVLLSSCDKSNPGVMMGMARVNRPSIFVGGGIGHNMCPSEILGTAMSMQCLAEALGISLPRTATTYATSPGHRHLSLQAGQQVMELVKRGIVPSDILTREAFENAIRVNMAIGGSGEWSTFATPSSICRPSPIMRESRSPLRTLTASATAHPTCATSDRTAPAAWASSTRWAASRR